MEAYEELRLQITELDGRVAHVKGRGILVRHGLAAWAQLRPFTVSSPIPESHSRLVAESPLPTSLGAELVRLIAGLILSTRQEHFLHA